MREVKSVFSKTFELLEEMQAGRGNFDRSESTKLSNRKDGVEKEMRAASRETSVFTASRIRG